ncbi:MAG: hypothetical protein ABFS34_04735 [Gemmatimonadota bacterium]
MPFKPDPDAPFADEVELFVRKLEAGDCRPKGDEDLSEGPAGGGNKPPAEWKKKDDPPAERKPGDADLT